MKGNSLVLTLAFVLAALSLGVTLLAYQYVQLTRSYNAAQYAISQVELRQNRLKALLGEAVEYAKRDASIEPILKSIASRPPSTNAPANPGPVPGRPAAPSGVVTQPAGN